MTNQAAETNFHRNLVTRSGRCCIAGGGPAGMMLGFLLARAGVHVLILEKHGDFLRDFRGDTIHPSTLEVMHELGLLPQLLQLPHQEAREVRAQAPDGPLEIRADLVVAADGRTSILREKAGLQAQELGAPMDVLWFRLATRPGDPEQTMARFEAG